METPAALNDVLKEARPLALQLCHEQPLKGGHVAEMLRNRCADAFPSKHR